MKKSYLTTPVAALCLIAVPLSAQTTGSTPTTDVDRSTYSARNDAALDQNNSTRTYERGHAKHAKIKKADHIIGKDILHEDGTKLGAISDLVIDAQSGAVTHAVVRSGAVLGLGGEAKAVSFDAFKPALGEQKGMTVAADQWQSARAFREDQLAILNTDDDRNFDTAQASTLVLASKLDDMDIHGTSGEEIGEVDDVLIHVGDHKAALLVELENDVNDNDDQSYVIGFNRIQLEGTGDNRRLTTELAQADFAKATTTASMDFGANEPFIWDENAMTAAE